MLACHRLGSNVCNIVACFCIERAIGLEIGLDAPDVTPRFTLVLWKLVLDHLEIVLVSVQDRCTVCTKRTLCSDIASNAPMVILGDEAQLEAPFSPFGESANIVAR